jgi:hypothetical protein
MRKIEDKVIDSCCELLDLLWCIWIKPADAAEHVKASTERVFGAIGRTCFPISYASEPR